MLFKMPRFVKVSQTSWAQFQKFVWKSGHIHMIAACKADWALYVLKHVRCGQRDSNTQ